MMVRSEEELVRKAKELDLPETKPAIASVVLDLMENFDSDSEQDIRLLSKRLWRILLSRLRGMEFRDDEMMEDRLNQEAQKTGIWPKEATPVARTKCFPKAAWANQNDAEAAGACEKYRGSNEG